jgi:hypothetical protein
LARYKHFGRAGKGKPADRRGKALTPGSVFSLTQEALAVSFGPACGVDLQLDAALVLILPQDIEK